MIRPIVRGLELWRDVKSKLEMGTSESESSRMVQCRVPCNTPYVQVMRSFGALNVVYGMIVPDIERA